MSKFTIEQLANMSKEERIRATGLHGKKIRYQNLLHATLMYNKYTVKKFFQIVEAEGIDFDPDVLIDGTDDTFGKPLDYELVKMAKERLYPYREQAMAQPDPIDVSGKKQKPLKCERKPLTWKIKDEIYPTYDRVRRVGCGMPPVNNPFKKDETKKEDNQKTAEETVNIEVIDKDGSVIEQSVGKPTAKPETEKKDKKENFDNPIPNEMKATKVFIPVNGIVNNDLQNDFDTIIGYIKDRVLKGTTINVRWNNVAGSFTATLTFPDKRQNSFTVDACTMLPDFYSILVSDKEYGTIAVPMTDPLANKIIATPMYQIEKSETEKILKKYYLPDIGLYYMYDFSSLKGLSKMGKKKKIKLSKILADVAESLKDKDTEDIPRFRFSAFKSIDDFEIVSDDKVKRPLGHLNENSTWIANATFQVKMGKPFQAVNESVAQTQVA